LFDDDECPNGIGAGFFQGGKMMKQHAFTLLELLVTLVMIGLIVTLAAPAFAEIIDNQRRQDAAQQLASGIRTARTEAILRSRPVVIRAIDGRWGNGWQIIVEGDAENPVWLERRRSGKVPIVGNGRIRQQIRFGALGTPYGNGFVAGTLSICDAKQAQSHRQVIMASTGRVRIESIKKPEPLCG
jgi:type IV fimbrial biogenesis protein FimT